MIYEFDNESKMTLVEPNCAEECCQTIRELGIDYDGCGYNLRAMRELVDELVTLAGNAIDFMYEYKTLHTNPKVVEEEEITRKMAEEEFNFYQKQETMKNIVERIKKENSYVHS